eukprot:1329648-Pleurochrysis_carterae.AAC.2
MAGSLAACEAVYLRGLLTELGFPPSGPTELRMDDSGAINLAHDPVSHTQGQSTCTAASSRAASGSPTAPSSPSTKERGQHGVHLH